MKKAIKTVLVALSGAGLAVAALAAGGMLFYATHKLPAGPKPLQFSISSGSSLTSAARQMADAGVIGRPGAFVMLARVLGEAGNIKAGSYEIEPPLTPYALVRKITRGDYTLDAITLLEGWAFGQIRAALGSHAALRNDTSGLNDAEVLERLAIESPSPEGWFFPDTYHFSAGTSDLLILARAHRLMQAHLLAQWERRAPGLPFASPYEALILASIIEKETGRAEERALVATVFINRLNRGMRLQADPTVIYGMGEAYDGNIRRRDLSTDTPFNTYTREGLPPTPIAMPGLAAIVAALNPADSDVLYFVSRGDGTSHFSRTLKEHSRAVMKYQRSGRR
jgi:UPF0755 protein